MKIIIKSLTYFSLLLLLILILTAWEIPAQGQLVSLESLLIKPTPFEGIGLNLDCKKINLDEDNQEEIIILRKLPNGKVILVITDGAGRFRWSDSLDKINPEIRDIADINGDGMLEIVIEENRSNSEKYLEIFAYNKAESKKIFAAEGYKYWRIQGAGKEIFIVEITPTSAKNSQAKVYRWQDGRYKLIKALKV